MRTQTLLIAAAAALAAAVTSTNAQTVYSANIVGYVNQVLPGSGSGYTLISVPLGGTNAADVAMPALNTFDSILVWTGSGYYTYQYVGAGANQPGGTGPGNWSNNDPGNPSGPPILTPGEGFFYQNQQGVAETNTWVGTVLLSNSVVLLGSGSGYGLNGSSVPVGDPADNTNIDLPLQTFDSVLAWTGNGYYTYQYVGNGYNTPGGTGPGNWSNNDPGNPSGPPTLTIGEGFFYQNQQGVNETWIQNDSYINP
jgi:hypothetical protein